MTVPFPLDHFDHAHPIRDSLKPHFDHGKLVSVGLTVAFHVVILAAALTAVHVSHNKVMQELSVSVLPQQKHEDPKDMAPPPRLIQPAMVTAPPPEVVIQTVTPPPVAAQPAPVAAPAPTTAPKSPVAGEGRDAFLGRLLAQLNRYKQYPRAARAAHIEGVVMLHFIIDANGKVLSFEIAKSSGRPILDAEALALIQRAQPLPALPADFPTRTLDAVVPVEFSLNA
jgi:periplasmic protein TonB